ncbi:MAG: DUF3999 domain-containing protein [Desulfosarcinaceae bacterium]|jgi:hypothetical protein
MKRLIRYALVFLVLSAAVANAAGPAPEDFAFGIPLTIDNGGGLNALPLPAAVYDALARADYGDLRVFNRAGLAMAHTLQTPASEPPAENWAAVAAFPLPAVKQATAAGNEIHVETSADGSIVHIRPVDRKPSARRRIRYHILDLSQVDAPVDRLRLSLAPAHTGLARLKVEAGEDLAHWRIVVAAAAVGTLDYLGHRLVRTEVALPRRTYTYLRLTWSPPLGSNAVETVTIRKPPVRGPLAREEIALTAREKRQAEGRAFIYYDIAGHRPVDRVRIDLPLAGTLARVVLASRLDEASPWRHRYSGLAYHIVQEGVTLLSGPVDLPAVSDPHWRLEIQSDPELQTRLPRLAMAWRPHRLIFTATDGGPFRLAYGSVRVPPANSHLDDLLSSLGHDRSVSDLPLARAGQPYELGGANTLAVRSDAWKRYLLWASMIVAVGLIGGLALRLYGQVKRTVADDEAIDQ